MERKVNRRRREEERPKEEGMFSDPSYNILPSHHHISRKNAKKNTKTIVHLTPYFFPPSILLNILICFILRSEKILSDSAVPVAPPARPLNKGRAAITSASAAGVNSSARKHVADVVDVEDESDGKEDGGDDGEDGEENGEEEEEEEESGEQEDEDEKGSDQEMVTGMFTLL